MTRKRGGRNRFSPSLVPSSLEQEQPVSSNIVAHDPLHETPTPTEPTSSVSSPHSQSSSFQTTLVVDVVDSIKSEDEYDRYDTSTFPMEYLKMIEEWRDVLPPYYFNLMVMGMKVTVEEKNFHQAAVITPENPPPVVEGSLSTKEGIPLGEEGRTPTLPSEPSSQSKKTNVFAWLVILHDLNSPPNLPFFLCNPRSNSLLSLEKRNEDSLLRPPPEPPPLLLYFLLLPTPNPHSSASTLDYSVPLPLPMHPSKHLAHISTSFPQMILLCVKSESLRGGEGKRQKRVKFGIC